MMIAVERNSYFGRNNRKSNEEILTAREYDRLKEK